MDKEALASVKVSRADVVKLLVADEKAAAKAAVDETWRELETARAAFMWGAADHLQEQYGRLLERLLGAVGSEPESIVHEVHYELYERDEQLPSETVSVTFRDGKPYECKFSVRLTCRLTQDLRNIRAAWAVRLVEHAAARDRDLRVGAVSTDVRGKLIKAALSETMAGRAVLAALKQLREAVADE